MTTARPLASEHPADVAAWDLLQTGSTTEGPTDGADGRPGGSYRSTCLADVEPERLGWLWPGRLPLGKLATLDGDPDIGKSTVMLDVAARVSTGRQMPGEAVAHLPASDVVLMAAEDGLADTIVHRLKAARADLTRVHHFDGVDDFDDDGHRIGTRPPAIPGDVTVLDELVEAKGARFVIVDVAMAYLGRGVDAYRDQDMRRALAPLAEMAHRRDACVVLLRHIPKSQRRAGQAVAAGAGSIGIIGLARAGLLAAADPDDETGRRRVLAATKSNLALLPAALTYELVGDHRHGCARVEWGGATTHTADALLRQLDGEERSIAEEDMDWLHSVLADGPMPYQELEGLALREGINKGRLLRARKRSGHVVSERDEGARGRPATWRLDSDFARPGFARNPSARNQQGSDLGEEVGDGGFARSQPERAKPISGHAEDQNERLPAAVPAAAAS